MLLAPMPLSWSSRVAESLLRQARRADWTVRIRILTERPQLADHQFKDQRVVVADGYTEGVIDALLGLRLPVLVLGSQHAPPPFPQVSIDARTIGRAAVDHLAAVGCTGIACLGHPRRTFSALLMDAARRRCGDLGLPFTGMLQPERWRAPLHATDRDADGDQAVGQWSRNLPAKTGILCWGDHAAIALHRLLPVQMFRDGSRMLLSAVDSPLLHGVEPAISAVAADPELFASVVLGAAVRLAEGQAIPQARILVPSQGILQRETTMPVAQADPLLADVLEQLAWDRSGVKAIGDIAKDLGISRRTLERRFRERLGLSPVQYRIRQRQERARSLVSAGMPRAAAMRLCGLKRHQSI
ncbi:MAG: Xylose operon regulatory protein [Planctomycetota bacterium]|jgi:LacI family transcriptional regulator